MAQSSGNKIHVGALMVIVSIKGFEKPSNEWIVKARIVFRGDAVSGMRKIKRQCLLTLQPQLLPVLVDLT